MRRYPPTQYVPGYQYYPVQNPPVAPYGYGGPQLVWNGMSPFPYAPQYPARYQNQLYGQPVYQSKHTWKRKEDSQMDSRDRFIGKVHSVKLIEYTDQGLVVEFLPTVYQAHLERPEEQREVTKETSDHKGEIGVLYWSAFSRHIQQMETEECINLCKDRLPIGSRFNVYVNNIDKEMGMIITLATKSAPLLNLNTNEEKVKGLSNYRYLIIVDLEATCDFSPFPVVDSSTAEIIEFPWIVFDTETMEVIYEKQLYIKPEDMNAVTPYCKVLTGITETNLDDGISLREAINQFNEYIESLPKDSFAILTDGVWDLAQLKQESERKDIKLDKWFLQYVNLKEEFRKFLPIFPFKSHEPSLHVMLQALSLKFVGKHHRGIDDCHSIVQVVRTLMENGWNFSTLCSVSEENIIGADSSSYITFTSIAPIGSWKCSTCTSKYRSDRNPYAAIWNKPISKSCRFCYITRSPDSEIANESKGEYPPLSPRRIASVDV